MLAIHTAIQILGEEEAMSDSVKQEDKEKLADLFQKLAGYYSWDDIYMDRKAAMGVVDDVIKTGWAPIESEKDNDG